MTDIETEIDFNSYETYSGGFGLYKELPKGITVNLNGELRLSEFDAVHPIAGVVREDRRYTGLGSPHQARLQHLGLCPCTRIHLRL